MSERYYSCTANWTEDAFQKIPQGGQNISHITYITEYITHVRDYDRSWSKIHRKNHKFARFHSILSEFSRGEIFDRRILTCLGGKHLLYSCCKTVILDVRIHKRICWSEFYVENNIHLCIIWHFMSMRGSIDAEMIANSCRDQTNWTMSQLNSNPRIGRIQFVALNCIAFWRLTWISYHMDDRTDVQRLWTLIVTLLSIISLIYLPYLFYLN